MAPISIRWWVYFKMASTSWPKTICARRSTVTDDATVHMHLAILREDRAHPAGRGAVGVVAGRLCQSSPADVEPATWSRCRKKLESAESSLQKRKML